MRPAPDMELREGANGIVIISSRLFTEEGFIASFTTRKGGWSPPPFDGLNMGFWAGDDRRTVAANRGAVLAELALDPTMSCSMRQVHGIRVAEVTQSDLGGGKDPDSCIEGTDGIFTRSSGVSLIATYADCAAIAVADKSSGCIGLVHAGWRGTSLKAVQALAASMGFKRTRSEDFIAAIGPHIGRCCYEVGEEVAAAISTTEACRPAVIKTEGGYRVDIGLANELQLKDMGFSDRSISRYNGCTSCEEDLFFSHRRDKGRTGRCAAVAASMRG